MTQRSRFSVGIGFPCNRSIPWQTAMKLIGTVHSLAMAGVPVNIHGVFDASLAHIARNVVLDNFLKSKEEHLFWIDSDIAWKVEDFVKVLRLAAIYGVVCGVYPLKREPVDCVVNLVEGAEPNVHGCVEIYGTGLGFTCIKRSILEELAATKETVWHAGNDRMILDAFRCDTVEKNGRKETRGEDAAFFADLRALGHKIWLEPTVQLGHIGDKVYQMEMAEPEAPPVIQIAK